jgi:hypothetical protein
MNTITILNYVPCLTKGHHADLTVTYELDDSGYSEHNITIDEVYCGDANITFMLTNSCKSDLASEVKKILDKEARDARDNYNEGRKL